MRACLAPTLALVTASACATAPTTHTRFVGPRFDLGPGPALAAVDVDADGRVVALHAALPVPDADVALVTLPGAVALPGLGDAHLHLAWLLRAREAVDLSAATSAADAARAVAAHARAHPDAAVVAGSGWDQTRWAEGAAATFPTAADLAADPHGRPIVLSRVDGHALWLDAVALARVADLLDAPSPPPERVLRGPDGRPSGVVVDPRPALVERLTPAPTAADQARWLAGGMALAADAGLVEVHDMATGPDELAALVALQAAGRLPLTVVVYVDASEASWGWLAAHVPGPTRLGPDLEVRGVKLFADGALGSRGAALLAPYSDEPGHDGQATPPDELTAAARRATALGYQVAIHAIGDRGNRHALAALEAAGAPRGRIEHVQVLAPGDAARLVAGGFVASMQPTHATSDMRWAQARIGPERLRGAYAWRSLLAAGAQLAFGTDAPVERHDPQLTLWAATRRQTPAGDPPGGWHPEEAVSFDEAVAAMSVGVAFAAGAERERGGVRPGVLLTLSVFDRDPRQDLLAARATATVRGRLVRPSSSRAVAK